MPLDVSKAPSTASPLWIIALFIALSEVTAGVAAITTDGTARLIFTCFAVAFPTAVFVVFVWLLIQHAPNLYAPSQYSKEITPEAYRIGISRADSILFGRAVAETVVPLLGEDHGGESHTAAVEQVARRFETAVEKSCVILSVDALVPGAQQLQIAVDSETTISELLDWIYFQLEPAVEPFSYDINWLLIGEDGTEYTDMGTPWARQRGLSEDTRPISAVGIEPGIRLTAVAKRRARRQRSAG